jgi:outer membrane protein assembly factor BamB
MGFSDNTLFVTTDLGVVTAVSTEDGSIIWTQDIFMGHGVSHPVVVGNRLVIGDSNGNVHTLDVQSGALVESRKVASGAILGVITYNRNFTVISSSGDLSTFSL